MKQDRIKRALHSFIDRMDYKLQRKAYRQKVQEKVPESLQ